MTTESNRTEFHKVADLLNNADSLIIAAGAGIGIDSGLPDFRGEGGFWKAYPGLGRQRMNFKDIASPSAFRTHPTLAWGFYGHRLNIYRDTVPHAGFSILKRWGEAMPQSYRVFTSNIDGQFQKAEFDPHKILECHGSMHHLQCLECCNDAIWSANPFRPDVDSATCRLINDLPRCPECGALARPNVLMFNDMEWREERTDRQSENLTVWLERVKRPVVIEIGAGRAIPSVRQFGQNVAQQRGGRLIRINPQESGVNPAHGIGIQLAALTALNEIEKTWSAIRSLP